MRGVKAPVEIRGVTYESMADAARALGVEPSTVREAKRFGWLDSCGTRPDLSDLAKRHTKPNPVTIRGVEYPSVRSAAISLGLRKGTVTNAKRRGTLDNCGTGEPNGNAIPVTVDGVAYPSISAAMKAVRRMAKSR